jgi:hypothetical protein
MILDFGFWILDFNHLVAETVEQQPAQAVNGNGTA